MKMPSENIFSSFSYSDDLIPALLLCYILQSTIDCANVTGKDCVFNPINISKAYQIVFSIDLLMSVSKR